MKRAPTNRLTLENCEDELVQEDRGEFSKADQTVVSERKTRTARRRSNINAGVGKIFSSFGGFNVKKDDNMSFYLKSESDNIEKQIENIKLLNKIFLENIQKNIHQNSDCILSPLFEDYNNQLEMIKTKFPVNNSQESKSETINSSSIPSFNNKTEFQSTKSTSNKMEEEENIVKDDKLVTNGSFLFADEKSKQENKPMFSFGAKSNESINGGSLFSDNRTVTEPVNPTFSFASTEKSDSNKPTSVPFSFMNNSTNSSSSSMFGNNAATGFSFGGHSNTGSSLFQPATFPTQSNTTAASNDDEEYVPPVAETKDVKEEGSVYDCRCKLFYKKDDKWAEKGVGNLFIKPMPEKKFQLILRADNSLATILLNILVNDKMPLSKNANNVSLVAMTDFFGKELKLTSLLMRVKTQDMSEELLTKMKQQLA